MVFLDRISRIVVRFLVVSLLARRPEVLAGAVHEHRRVSLVTNRR